MRGAPLPPQERHEQDRRAAEGTPYFFVGMPTALASATAFLIGQLLDIAVFSRLRAARAWFLQDPGQPTPAGPRCVRAAGPADPLHVRLHGRRRDEQEHAR